MSAAKGNRNLQLLPGFAPSCSLPCVAFPTTMVFLVLCGALLAQEQVPPEGRGTDGPKGRGGLLLPEGAMESEQPEELEGADSDLAAPRPVTYRGLNAEIITRAEGYEAEPMIRKEKKEADFHLDLRIMYDDCPPYIREEGRYNPPIDIEPLRDCPQVRGLKNLVENELFRQLRSRLKRSWRDQFSASNLSYDFYVDRLIDINQIGRDMESRDQVTENYYLMRARENVFHRYRDEEDEIPVIKLGPLTVQDSGSLTFDASLLTRMFGDHEDGKAVELGPKEDSHQPLFSGKCFRVRTRLRTNLDPFRAVSDADVMHAFSSYGMVIDVAWLTDILRRERFTTEFETQYNRSGEFALFFNLVVKSW
jgi:hypothetical protein